MGIFDFFRRDSLDEEERVIRDAVKDEDRRTADTDISSNIKEAASQEIDDFMNKLYEVTKDKRKLYDIYRKMSKDSMVAGAMSLLADDIVKKDLIRDKRVWIEESDLDTEDEDRESLLRDLENFLNDIDIESKVWGYAYNLLMFGQVYLKTYNKEFGNKEMDKDFVDREGYIYEIEEHPEDILTLEKYGVKVGYGRAKRDKDDKETQGYDLLPTTEYVSICSDKKMLRQTVKLTYKDNENGAVVEKTEDFKSVIGSSYLEDVREAWSICDLIETLLLYARWYNTDCFRTVQVEVGSAGKVEATRILRNVKRTFTNQDAMNVKEGTYSGYHKPIPQGNNIYLATRSGKGQITIDDHAPTFDLKEATDLDYWQNKKASALIVPKAYLGLSDDNLTGLNNQSLTRIDIRYCRTVEAFKESLSKGIKDICDYWLTLNGREQDIDKYKICMAPIMSAETSDRMEDVQARIELANALRDFMSQVQAIDMDRAAKVIVEKILDLESVDPEFDDIWRGDYLKGDGTEEPEQDIDNTEDNLPTNDSVPERNNEPEEEPEPEQETENEVPQLEMGPGAPTYPDEA